MKREKFGRVEILESVEKIYKFQQLKNKRQTKDVKSAYKLLSEYFGANNEKEVSLLAVIIHHFMKYNNTRYMDFSDLKSYFGFNADSDLDFMIKYFEIENLYKKKYVFNNPFGVYIKKPFDNKTRIYINKDFLLAVQHGENVHKSLQKKNEVDIVSIFSNIAYCGYDENTFNTKFMYLEVLFKLYPDNRFVKRLKDFVTHHKEYYAFETAITMLSRLICDLGISSLNVRECFSEVDEFSKIVKYSFLTKIKEGKTYLNKCGFFNFSKSDQIDKMSVSLDKSVMRDLLGSDYDELSSFISVKSSSLIKHDKIVKKELFYNTENAGDINRLFETLEDKNYKKITKSLSGKGFKKGLTIILHGGPGTGKTETVLQLAKQTKRDVLKLNIEEIRSCWVGESEKNMKNLFESYKTLNNSCKKTPILFLNECDAIISKRTDIGTNASVDKMENSLQNILLDELENFEGILIATTNMVDNIDNAFDRRFLFKMELNNPSVEVKEKIWKSKLKNVSDDIIKDVSTNFDFSGGQIDNVVKKITIDNILWGSEITRDMINDFCSKEQLKKVKMKPIGFSKQ